MCVCEGYGYRTDDANNQMCAESKELFYLKSVSHLPKKFICFNDSLSEMMKNAFSFILKAFFILKIFKLLYWVFGHVEKKAWLERQD